MTERIDHERILMDIFMEYLYKRDEVTKGTSVGMLFTDIDMAELERMLSGDKFSVFMDITNSSIKDELVTISEHIKYRVYPAKLRFGKTTTMIRFESISTSMKRTIDIGLAKKRSLDSIRSEILDYSQGAPLTPQLVYQNLFRDELGSKRRDSIHTTNIDPIGELSKGRASTNTIRREQKIPFSISDVQEYLNVLCILGMLKRKGVNYYPR